MASHPEVPTIAEQGLPGFEALTWAGLLAPAATPRAIIDRLNLAANHALNEKSVIEHFDRTSSTIKGGTSTAFGQFLSAEIAKWGKAVVASGARLD